jgi:hypothetical protein
MLLKAVVDIATTRPQWDIADIFRKHWREYQRRYGLSDHQARVIRHITECRTAALGGYRTQCDNCGKLQIAYCSCRDRHCPKCGAWERAQWLAAQEQLLLPTHYFHVVFTTDHAINVLVAAGNDRVIYDLLFQAATETLKAYGQRELGGELGITAVLHTWGQQLPRHIHLHTLVTGGALGQTESGRPRWRASSPNYLFDIVAVAETFRDKFCDGLLALYRAGQLVLRGAAADVDVPALVAEMRAKKWEVYARPARDQETDGGAEKVLDYFGRYVNRVAIANYRIVDIKGRQVSFRYYDNPDGGKEKVLTLDAVEFIRRFLQHVLPKGYMRIRHYGLHHNHKRAVLAQARRLLGGAAESPAPPELTLTGWLTEILGQDPHRCPFCGVGDMVSVGEFGPVEGWRAIGLRLLGVPLRGRAAA